MYNGTTNLVMTDSIEVMAEAMTQWLDVIVLLVVLGFIIGVFVRLGSLFSGSDDDDDEEHYEDEEPEDNEETLLEVKKKHDLIRGRSDNTFYNEVRDETFNVREKGAGWKLGLLGLGVLLLMALLIGGITYVVSGL
jgi:hypothetical protein